MVAIPNDKSESGVPRRLPHVKVPAPVKTAEELAEFDCKTLETLPEYTRARHPAELIGLVPAAILVAYPHAGLLVLVARGPGGYANSGTL